MHSITALKQMIFYKNWNPKVVRKNKVYTSWADINGRRWYIKTNAEIRDFDEYTYCLKVGTSSSGASYLELKPDISKSKIRKISYIFTNQYR